MPWLQLIRWKNLLIIFFTQFLAWWCVILPREPGILNPINFCCLSLSTMLIAAAGYIINDYFDIKIDSINRPEKVVLEKVIPRKQAIISHISLNIIALLLAGFVAAKAHHLSLLVIQLVSISLLWFYSTHFKRMFMVGNIVIAFLTALTILMLIFYEPWLWWRIAYPALEETSLQYLDINPFWLLVVCSFFAFMLTWIREIVKDLEDLKGDTEESCNTLPVKWGISGSLVFVRVLAMITLVVLALCGVGLYLSTVWLLLYSGVKILILYIILFLMCPVVILMVNIGKDYTSGHFHAMSSRLKLIMLSGIFSLFVYHCIEWIR